MTLLATSSSYAETTQRLNDYIVFLSPRMIEGFWDLFEKLNYVKTIQHFDKFIFVMSMTICHYIRKYYRDSVPKNYEKILTFVYGKK